jgi:hypothetical protein
MISPLQVRSLVVKPALLHIGRWTQAAENLVMGTAAQESNLIYVRQMENGPARGLWQMEPDTHDDIWDNYLAFRSELASAVKELASKGFPQGFLIPADDMVGNMAYAAAMCRVHYMRVSEALPDENDRHGMARYWKKYYNTEQGKGTEAEFLGNYTRVTLQVKDNKN